MMLMIVRLLVRLVFLSSQPFSKLLPQNVARPPTVTRFSRPCATCFSSSQLFQPYYIAKKFTVGPESPAKFKTDSARPKRYLSFFAYFFAGSLFFSLPLGRRLFELLLEVAALVLALLDR